MSDSPGTIHVGYLDEFAIIRSCIGYVEFSYHLNVAYVDNLSIICLKAKAINVILPRYIALYVALYIYSFIYITCHVHVGYVD